MNDFWSVRFEGFSKVRVYGSRSHVGSPGSLLQDVEDCPHRRLSMWLLHHVCTVDGIVSILPAILRLQLFPRNYQLIFRKLHVEALPCAKNAQTPTGFARRCLCGIVTVSFFVHRSMAKLGLVDLVILLMINLRRLTVRLVLVLGLVYGDWQKEFKNIYAGLCSTPRLDLDTAYQLSLFQRLQAAERISAASS